MSGNSAKLPRKKVGLALGSGAARGLAHIGVVEVLQREGIGIDMIVGTSTGAVVGALYAQGKDASLMKDLAKGLDWKRVISLVDLTIPKTGFIGGKKLKNWLGLIIGDDIKFSDLKIPLACVATDIYTGEEVVITQGLVLEAVRASISIPGIFSVVEWHGRYLVDGGLADPVPVDALRGMGADFIIAVNVIPEASEFSPQKGRGKKQALKEPSIFGVLLQTVHIATHTLVEHSLEGADVVIHPKVADIQPGDFHRAQECILRGEVAAKDSIPEIKRLLPIG